MFFHITSSILKSSNFYKFSKTIFPAPTETVGLVWGKTYKAGRVTVITSELTQASTDHLAIMAASPIAQAMVTVS